MDEYYERQAGSGIGGFSGIRYQKGDGFFGRLVSGAILPILKKVLPFLGKTALKTGINIAGDLADGNDFKESFKRRFKDTADFVESKAMNKVREMTGGAIHGPRRRTKPRKRKTNKRKKKTAKSKRRPSKTSKRTKKSTACNFLT